MHKKMLWLWGCLTLLALGGIDSAFAGSETPPAGPPWKTNFDEAQREALRTGKPLFVYFTKTY